MAVADLGDSIITNAQENYVSEADYLENVTKYKYYYFAKMWCC